MRWHRAAQCSDMLCVIMCIIEYHRCTTCIMTLSEVCTRFAYWIPLHVICTKIAKISLAHKTEQNKRMHTKSSLCHCHSAQPKIVRWIIRQRSLFWCKVRAAMIERHCWSTNETVNIGADICDFVTITFARFRKISQVICSATFIAMSLEEI